MSNNVCKVEGCDTLLNPRKNHTAQGLCVAHYHRLKRYGDPTIVGQVEPLKAEVERLNAKYEAFLIEHKRIVERKYEEGFSLGQKQAPEISTAILDREYSKGYQAGKKEVIQIPPAKLFWKFLDYLIVSETLIQYRYHSEDGELLRFNTKALES